jgi:hypothetical protein
MRRACETIRPRPGTHVASRSSRLDFDRCPPCSAEPRLASGAEWRAWLSRVPQSSRKTRITMIMITMSPMIPTPVPSARVGIEAPSGTLPFIPRRAGCRNGRRRTSRTFEESRGAWTRLGSCRAEGRDASSPDGEHRWSHGGVGRRGRRVEQQLDKTHRVEIHKRASNSGRVHRLQSYGWPFRQASGWKPPDRCMERGLRKGELPCWSQSSSFLRSLRSRFSSGATWLAGASSRFGHCREIDLAQHPAESQRGAGIRGGPARDRPEHVQPRPKRHRVSAKPSLETDVHGAPDTPV